ncbi:hypothetical protein ABK040_013473 [Willaertia magna]
MSFPEHAKPHFKSTVQNRANFDDWRVSWKKETVAVKPTTLVKTKLSTSTGLEQTTTAVKDVAVDHTQPTKQYRLVSSAHGAILEMLLTIPDYAMEDKSLKAVYDNIFHYMPKYTRLTILIDKSAKDAVEELLTKYERNTPELVQIIVKEDESENISIWAEDAYVCNYIPTTTQNEKVTRFLTAPIQFPRYADSTIALQVSNEYEGSNPLKVRPTPLIFQGGNTLIGDDFFMVGKDYLMDSIDFVQKYGSISQRSGETLKDAVIRSYKTHLDTTRRLIFPGTADERPCPNQVSVPFIGKDEKTGKDEYRNEVLYFGNGRGAEKVWEPLFHIDMFITLLGRNKETNKYQVLVASPELAVDTLGWDKEKVRFAYAMQLSFDEIAKQLEDEGFEVDRMSLPMVYFDSEEDGTKYWYFTTYNNCLVQIPLEDNETVNGIKVEKKVWLPQYGYGAWESLKATDEAAIKKFEKYGFTVQPMGDFHPFASNLGALHCIKKYLLRTVPSN